MKDETEREIGILTIIYISGGPQCSKRPEVRIRGSHLFESSGPCNSPIRKFYSNHVGPSHNNILKKHSFIYLYTNTRIASQFKLSKKKIKHEIKCLGGWMGGFTLLCFRIPID